MRRGECRRVHRVVIIQIEVFPVKIRRNITGQTASAEFHVIRLQRPPFDLCPACGIDRMSDVGMQFHAMNAVAVTVLLTAVFVKVDAAVVAESGAQVFLSRQLGQ